MGATELMKDFHIELVEAMRRRNAKEHDIEDPDDFEAVMAVVEELGAVAKRAAEKKVRPVLVGQAMLYYAKCIAVALVKPSVAQEVSGG